MERIPKYLPGVFAAVLLCFFFNVSPVAAGEGPEEVTIDLLAQNYEPVEFPHAMHEEVVEGNCAVCHHHTLGLGTVDRKCAECHTGSPETDEVACQECHAVKRFEAEYLNKLSDDSPLYHLDRLGLKAAFHTRCLNCHAEMGVATGCQDCHVRNDAGDKFFHAGPYAPPKGTGPAGAGH